MTRVVAMTIRATNCTLPGYGASSPLSHPKSRLEWLLEAGKDCAIDAISTPAYDNDGGLAHSKKICGRVFNAYSNRIPGCKMDPVERSLYIRQTLVEAPDDVSVRGHAEPHTIYNP